MRYRIELAKAGARSRMFEVTDDGEHEISHLLFGIDIESRCDDISRLTLYSPAIEGTIEGEPGDVALVHRACLHCQGHEIIGPLDEA